MYYDSKEEVKETFKELDDELLGDSSQKEEKDDA